VSKEPSQVFISYSQDAKPRARKLSESLETRGVSTWADFKSIRPGQRFLEEIERALDDSQYFLLVVGPKHDIGEWQDREWMGALQRTWDDSKKRIIPVLVDDATPPSFLRRWVSVRVRPGKSESEWINPIYDAVRGRASGERGALNKQNAKPSKAFRNRLEEIESTAKGSRKNNLTARTDDVVARRVEIRLDPRPDESGRCRHECLRHRAPLCLLNKM
jgi:TIR domain